ncbi:MAG: type II secretion system protein [Phycisphaerales bacterium]
MPARAGGFTLIELLVTISIIAILMAIIVPAAAGARETAQQTLCQSNLRQLGLSWSMYLDEFRAFPLAEDDRTAGDSWARSRVRWSWGGTGVDERASDAARQITRPMNAYLEGGSGVAGDVPGESGGMIGEVTRSPRDRGIASVYDAGVSPWGVFGLGRERVPLELDRPVAEVVGTSYFANEWQYCLPGAEIGFVTRDSRGRDAFKPGLGLRHVSAEPWQLVTLAPAGWSDAARYTLEERQQERYTVWEGYWYGPTQTHFAFADGSVRVEDLEGQASTSTATVYLAPTRHRMEGGWKRADRP